MCVLTCWECRFELLLPVNVCVVAWTKCYSSVVVVYIAYVVVMWCVWVGMGGGGVCMWVCFD
jgi:hypothetical protein